MELVVGTLMVVWWRNKKDWLVHFYWLAIFKLIFYFLIIFKLIPWFKADLIEMENTGLQSN